MTEREALRLALEALKQIDEAMPFPVAKLAQKAIREALAQPKQEPSFWMDSLDIEHRTPAIITNEDKREGHLNDWRCIHPVYTTPPQRKPLTDEEIAHATAPVFMGGNPSLTGIARAIEAAHGIKE